MQLLKALNSVSLDHEDTYITEHQVSLQNASSNPKDIPRLKVQRLERRPLGNQVDNYVGTIDTHANNETVRWCNVLAAWLLNAQVKFAHIVPYAWNRTAKKRVFRGSEDPLTSAGNGLCLQGKIELLLMTAGLS